MRHRIIALAGAIVAGTALNAVAWASPAAAEVPGFEVRVSAPERFTAGRSAATVTAVVTSENRRCRKVRWVLLVRTPVGADQLRVTRVEDNGEFATDTSTEGDTTTITDEALDPGTLCRGRTVTGRWQIGFEGPDGGDVRFEARAFDAEQTLLTTAGATATVRGERGASPSAEPSEEAGEDAAEEEEAPAEETGPVIPADSDEPEAALVAEESTLLGPGLIVGGICVFLGVLLLVRLRARARTVRIEAETLPTGFYRMPPPR
ncbi:hypothetical protein Ait01nite_095600 [Actinoplanes italicus]|uniref:Uncharacterized protein n=1 Tax=Actinoplanes italicus TaxID=113567 RepID=A0A2T0JMP3_9ACTN|nr:hypothetical protein [Actinoplanes italicus]PRX08888.1 hypothetical protein CLV67_13820 [Actinoplanes italicus]GIE36515.1 hypothetical protein Ait01nite_095600 [Actinoplanes italicus]